MRRFTTLSSDGKRTYRMHVDRRGNPVCGCPGYFYRGKCRHGRELEMLLDLQERIHELEGNDDTKF